jgi:putative membrane protein
MRFEVNSRPAARGPVAWVTQWLVSATALALVAHFDGGLRLAAGGAEAAVTVLGAAAVLGLLNLLLRPVLLLVTLPVNILSLGLFTLVVNGVVLLAVAALVPGLAFSGFWSAVWAALWVSVLSLLLGALLGGAALDVRMERGR